LALVIGAFAYLGWRKPRGVGVLLIVFAPLEALNILWGAMMIVDSNAVVIERLVFFGGLPLVAGLLLTAAARSRRGSS
jgi:cytochrome c oxidase subunit IV